MNESIRTMMFVATASVVSFVAWWYQPVPPAPPSNATEQIIAPFEVSDANRFKIVQYDEDLGKLNTFEVAKENGRWVIPSHRNYPADAAEQLKKIAGLFVEMKPIATASTDPKTHELYGVREPKDEGSGDTKGLGRLVTISDKSDAPLVELIVGKEATRDTASNDMGEKKEYHYVRRVGQDPVYVAEISLDALTTKFEDWIERDLLNLNSFDVAKLDLRDYSIVPVSNPNNPNGITLALLRRMDTVVSWNGATNAWELDKLTLYQDNEALQGKLADDEELNKAKLDGVKTAIDDLKIIDVDRKPSVLSEALKDEKFMRSGEAIQELRQHGFFPMQGENGKPQILGSNGGLRVTMKDGVQYVLNFGNAKSAEKGDSTKLNRYLMVTAQIDESMLPPPQLEPEEPEPAGPTTPEGEKSADEKSDEAAADKKDDATDEAKEGESVQKDEATKKERERIKKENQRKMDEYHAKQKQAQARVNELNARFGDWFYVVSDDVYKKVQLGRADIVKDRETAKDEGFGVDAFRKLEDEGVEGKKTTTTPAPPAPPSLPGFGVP
jgi:hypothetical protein